MNINDYFINFIFLARFCQHSAILQKMTTTSNKANEMTKRDKGAVTV
jgi:hypothetical protein